MTIKNFKPMECPICHQYYFSDDPDLKKKKFLSMKEKKMITVHIVDGNMIYINLNIQMCQI